MRLRLSARILIGLCSLVAGVTAIAGEDDRLLLAEVVVNYMPQGTVLMLWDGDTRFSVRAADLEKWRVRRPYPEPAWHDGDAYYALSYFPGVTADYDAASVAVAFSIPPRNLEPMFSSLMDEKIPSADSVTGFYLDYDWSYTDTGESAVAGLIAPTVFTPAGNLKNDFIYRDYGDLPADSRSQEEWIRLTSTFTRDDPDRMLSYRAGDLTSTPGLWGGGYRLGGVQVATNFATRPGYITFPVPSLEGEARVPSVVDLYVNGVLRNRNQVPPGQFRVDDIPVVTGEGQVQMVVTDILGREQVVVQDFYASAQLLREGLSDWSYSIGKLRRNFGLASNEYGEGVLLARHRYGLNSSVTLGGRMELSDFTQIFGGSMDWALPRGGVASTGLGWSTGRAGRGMAWSLGYQYLGSDFHISARASGTSKGFTLIDPEGIFTPPSLQTVVSAGWRGGMKGSVGATLVHQSFRDRVNQNVLTLTHSRILPGRISLAVYTSWREAEVSDFSLGFSFSKPFGYRQSAGGSAGYEQNEFRVRAETQYSLPAGPGVGYRLGTSLAENNQYDANVVGQTDFGRYSLDAQQYGDNFSWRANAMGSLAWMAGRSYFAREINDGFAVAKVGNFSDVRVYVDNQEIGRSDSRGRILLPALRPYEINRVRIEANDLPIQARIGAVEMIVSPAFRSGTVVNFDVDMSFSVIVYARLSGGGAVPEGAVARISGRREGIPVGLNGMIYLTGLDGVTDVEVTWREHSCSFTISIPTGDHPLPSIPATCTGERIPQPVVMGAAR